MSDRSKSFDIKGFADAFGEAFDLRDFSDAFRRAFDIGNAGRSFVAGFRRGAKLVTRHLRRAIDPVRAAAQPGDVQGLMLLQRLAADVAGGGGSAVRALAEIRRLLRPFNPEIDRISDDHIPGIVQRLIEDLQKPAARPEDFSGAVSRTLAEAQAKAAALAFADAAQVLDAALDRTVAEDQERARGRAALLAERGRVARLQLRYRDAATFYQQAADAVGLDTSAAWIYAMHAALALSAQGEEFGDNSALKDAIGVYKSAQHLVPRDRMPLEWAATENNLGNTLRVLGEREIGTTRLEEAVAAYHAALEEFTRERVPSRWAMTQNNLGNALSALGERERSKARLEEAISAYRAALQERTREGVPLQWATTQTNLGNALRALGERESGTGRLEEAVAAYRAALQEWTREHAPLQWAGTQDNLGSTLACLSERESGTTRLEEAVTAFRSALQERTREHVPLQWAMTQNNFGNALRTLGERENGKARRKRLEAAIAAYDAALQVFVQSGADYYVDATRANREEVIQLLAAE